MVLKKPNGFKKTLNDAEYDSESEYESEHEADDAASSADDVMKFYLNNINSTPVEKEVAILESYEEQLPPEMIIYAMEKAVENKGRSLGYIKGILNSWLAKGITTLAEAKEENEQYKKKPKPKENPVDLNRYRSDDEIDYDQFYANL